jgi:hypothetical protein
MKIEITVVPFGVEIGFEDEEAWIEILDDEEKLKYGFWITREFSGYDIPQFFHALKELKLLRPFNNLCAVKVLLLILSKK